MKARNPPRSDPEGALLSGGVLDRLLGHAIRQAKFRVRDAFAEAMIGTGLTTQRFTALVLIAENPGLKQIDIAKAMGIARSGATSIISALEEQHLIERAPSPDGRAFALELSAAGRRALPDLIARAEEHDKALTGKLSREEVSLLKGLLARVRLEHAP
ncbi:MarR family winged helix-turn-helix transcriptional regulator [Caulobacter sp. RL271]|uniref:MarR family transcriptional regulator n=1 Tax=Caulobacter segnis TaxID=88688 RepID=A0ABY4ZRF3_9CAUL|nr:MarR family transcriptional regulator [Caulobacter segnis]USQ95270.1 MarR family transcriptional regulator [Caulobacter segnis]